MPAFKTTAIVEATRSVEADCHTPPDPVLAGSTRLFEARAAAVHLVCHEGAV